jgi:putative salt-induced outer membrane protein YdiY
MSLMDRWMRKTCRTRRWVWASVAGVMLAPACAVFVADTAAQVVNIETKRRDERKDGVSGTARLNFQFRAGNVKRVDVDFDNFVQVVKNRHIFLGMAGLQFAQAKREDDDDLESVENERFWHLRHNYVLSSWLLTEVFYQRQVNRFIDLKSRNLVGVGARFRLFRSDRDALYLGTTPMYEREHLEKSHAMKSGGTARWSNYIAARLGSVRNLDLTSTLYYQPRFSELDDFRILEEAALTVDLSAWMALSIRYTLRYDSTPPAGVNKSDQKITQGLTFTY